MMNFTIRPRVKGNEIRRGGMLAIMITAVFAGAPVLAQQPAANEPTEAARSVARMMDPNTWIAMMTMSMDPRIWVNPISSCAACHNNEDVARYQQVFGPFTGMTNPGMWTSPETYNDMVAAALGQESAERWARAVAKKYGLKPGETAPTMHGWWPVMPMRAR